MYLSGPLLRSKLSLDLGDVISLLSLEFGVQRSMLYLELGVLSSRLNLELRSTLYRDWGKLKSELGLELYEPTEPEPLIDILEPSIDLSASKLLFRL